MTKTSKTLATIGAIFVFLILSALIQIGSGPGGRSPGIIGIILLFGLIAALRAIWKKPTQKNTDNVDNTTLNKS